MTGNISDWKKRAALFLEKNIAVHIVTKSDSWFNGYILKVYDDYFDILDREDGAVPVFFADIHILELYQGDLSRLKKIEVKE